MTQLVLESAVRQLELLRSGEVSIRALAEAHLHQIDRLNPALNVFADFDATASALTPRALRPSRSKLAALFTVSQ